MKLAHISTCYKPVVGGQEVYIKNLQEVLKNGGVESVVYQPDRGARDTDVIPVWRLKGFPRLIPGSDGQMFNVCLKLLHGKELDRYDVIISHYALHAWPLRKYAKKTIVLSHGVEWHIENQTWNDRQREGSARKCLDSFTHVVNDTHYLRYFGYDVKPAQGFFTEVSPGKWFIPNCVDTDYFCPGKGHPSLKGKRVILVPRQMVPDRGIDLAIKAFAEVLKQDNSLEMCLLGKRHSGEYVQYLDQLIIDLNLAGKVYFSEGVSNAEMPAWYNGALVTVIPTLRREGTSLSALESMSCGVATVSTNVAGLADLPTLQCDPEVTSLKNAILEAVIDREAIGEKQKVEVQKTFNMHNWSETWMNVVLSVSV